MKNLKLECYLCGAEIFEVDTLVLGKQPASNKFSLEVGAIDNKFDLSLGQCKSCALVQLVNAPSIDAITPTLPWISYGEPVEHLGVLSQFLRGLLMDSAVIYGVGPFDAPLIERLSDLRPVSGILDLMRHIPINVGLFPYLESYQIVLTKEVLSSEINYEKKAQLVVCRYLLEHCKNPIATLKALESLLDVDGYLFIEVPDSSKFINVGDYSFIWEEHNLYFTDMTFRRLVASAGLKVHSMFRFPGVLEDALVFILQSSDLKFNKSIPIAKKELVEFEKYRSNFDQIKQRYHLKMKELVSAGNLIAIFGAGHQTISFINLFGIDSYIECIIDDDENKRGMYLPGSHLPIISSIQFFDESRANICLLGIGPKSEKKVLSNLEDFTDRGGIIYSIFPGSKLANLVG